MIKFIVTMTHPETGPTGVMYIPYESAEGLTQQMDKRGYTNVNVRPLHVL